MNLFGKLQCGVASLAALVALAANAWAEAGRDVVWKHLSSKTGDIETPNSGREQCSASVFDIDKDSVNDFVITERTATPSVVWYRRSANGWKKYLIDNTRLNVEAGATSFDVDGDGDLDFVAAGDSEFNEIWWWENPYPHFDPTTPWMRHVIKNTGGKKHHDILFGDFDGDGNLDIFCAEMRLGGRDPDARTMILLGDGKGNFEPLVVARGIGLHESKMADLDGNGTLDILGKPYDFDTPRLDIWLNMGRK